MQTIILIIITGTFNLLSFLIGAKVAQKIQSNQEIEIINPIKSYEEYKERKENKKDTEAYNLMMDNINNYNGTSTGQKDIPN